MLLFTVTLPVLMVKKCNLYVILKTYILGESFLILLTIQGVTIGKFIIVTFSLRTCCRTEGSCVSGSTDST